MIPKIWIGITTAYGEKEAILIAKNLVSHKLAACVNIIPKIKSFFFWEGRLCAEEEVILLIKTTSEQGKKIIREIKKLHSYQVPEIIFWEIKEGEENYCHWVQSAVKGVKKRLIKRKNKEGNKKY